MKLFGFDLTEKLLGIRIKQRIPNILRVKS